MKLSELKKIINQIDSREDITNDPEVIFQGSVYSVWVRKADINGPFQLVIAAHFTESEV